MAVVVIAIWGWQWIDGWQQWDLKCVRKQGRVRMWGVGEGKTVNFLKIDFVKFNFESK
jgi:hypothetical protein